MTAEEKAIEPATGAFTAESRAAAVAGSIPLLASYFADAPTWNLDVRPELGTGDSATDEIVALLRLRVVLAAARALTDALSPVMQRPNQRWFRSPEESIGGVRGRLDIYRYVRERARPSSPPARYPVMVVRRTTDTPENALAAYAVAWLLTELRTAPSAVLPATCPERRELHEHRRVLGRYRREPILREAAPRADRVWRRGGLRALTNEVGGRLAMGHVAHPDRYGPLLTWIASFNPRSAAAEPGLLDWAIYDERFDAKLFELWALSMLTVALTDAFGAPITPEQPLRSGLPVATWFLGSGRARLSFQTPLKGARWRYIAPSAGALRGTPDITVAVQRPDGAEVEVLVDPKLRVRSTAPAEEIYKLLGYFENSPDTSRTGVLLMYAPQGGDMPYELATESGGKVLVLGVDPARPTEASAAMGRVARLVAEMADLDDERCATLRTAAAASGEQAAAMRQQLAVEGMLKAAAKAPAEAMAAARKATSAHLHLVWDFLSASAQTMLVTAEHFGHYAPADADHSGPMLGLAAACELMLHDHLLEPLAPELARRRDATLGGVITWLDDALSADPRRGEGRRLRDVLKNREAVDERALRVAVLGLRRLNTHYRIPSAHRAVLSQRQWAAGRALILAPTDGLLVQITVGLGAAAKPG